MSSEYMVKMLLLEHATPHQLHIPLDLLQVGLSFSFSLYLSLDVGAQPSLEEAGDSKPTAHRQSAGICHLSCVAPLQGLLQPSEVAVDVLLPCL